MSRRLAGLFSVGLLSVGFGSITDTAFGQHRVPARGYVPVPAVRGAQPVPNYRYTAANWFGMGIGVGIPLGPDGAGTAAIAGPYFWPFFPWDYPGFYGNGFSKYGPPVPTYGPIPGVFGGSDQKNYGFIPTWGYGLGWWGYRSPSPRPLTNVQVHPQAPMHPLRYEESGLPSSEALSGPPASAPSQTLPSPRKLPEEEGQRKGSLLGPNDSLHIEVLVPKADAKIWIDDHLTQQQGERRLFQTPSLGEGGTAVYTIRAEWNDQGQTVRRTKVIGGTAGHTIRIDMTDDRMIGKSPSPSE